MAKGNELIVGLDVGTTKICAVVGEVKMDGTVDIIGVGRAPSKGLRKGIVVNIESTVESIKTAVKEAELMAGVEIRSVNVGIAGGHIKGFNSRGVIAAKGGEISQADIDRVVEAAKAVAIPLDREMLHVLTKEFIVDGQDGVMDPRGMSGVRLEAEVHIVTGAVAAVQNLVKCCEKADLEVADIVLEPLASAEATLDQDEKDLGIGIVDIGGGTTDIALFHQGSICHTSVIAIGGNQFTTDLAVGLRITAPEAERIKVEYATALMSNVSDDEVVRLKHTPVTSNTSTSSRRIKEVPRRHLVAIIQPRTEELLNLVRQEIEESVCGKMITAGVVFTGGATQLDGMLELAEYILDLPVRRAVPVGVGGLIDIVSDPRHATGVGLVLYGAKKEFAHLDLRSLGEEGLFFGILNRMKLWVEGLFKF